MLSNSYQKKNKFDYNFKRITLQEIDHGRPTKSRRKD